MAKTVERDIFLAVIRDLDFDPSNVKEFCLTGHGVSISTFVRDTRGNKTYFANEAIVKMHYFAFSDALVV